MDVVHILGEVAQVVGYLQAQFAGRRKDKSLRLTLVQVNALQQRQAERRRLSRSRLGQRYHITTLP